MDSFVPPGYMTLGELVDRTGRALFGDGWTEAPRAQAEAEARWKVPSDRVSLEKARNARTPRPGHYGPYRAPLPPEELERFREAAAAAEPEMQRTAARVATMHQEVITTLRTALYTGDKIEAVIKTAQGQLVEVPPHFWLSDGALSAFTNEEVTVGPGFVGRVLFLLAQDKPALEPLTEDKVRQWIQGQIAAGLVAARREMWKAMQQELGGTFPRERFEELLDEYGVDKLPRGRKPRKDH